jgi:catechol 2,3-dioxygenase-like lactoylglutathione lyase family enzyme
VAVSSFGPADDFTCQFDSNQSSESNEHEEHAHEWNREGFKIKRQMLAGDGRSFVAADFRVNQLGCCFPRAEFGWHGEFGIWLRALLHDGWYEQTLTDMSVRYAHTNIIAKDWEQLAEFYVEVFECEPVSTVRDHHGPQTDALVSMTHVRVRGRHLRVPGHGENGPTIEIFTYDQQLEPIGQEINRTGFAHLAFEVDDLPAKREQIKGWGGGDYGELVTIDIEGAGKLTLIYMTDPEGNIVELQQWS